MPRQRYIQDPVTHKLIPADEYTRQVDPNAPFVLPDIAPYQSMATGEMITSRSHHRAHLRQHGLIEIGNEINAHMKTGQRSETTRERESRRQSISEAIDRARAMARR